jgi:hypothetical protein
MKTHVKGRTLLSHYSNLTSNNFFDGPGNPYGIDFPDRPQIENEKTSFDRTHFFTN